MTTEPSTVRHDRDHPVDSFFPPSPMEGGRLHCPNGQVLTKRETEIVWLIWLGKTNIEIAETFVLSNKTIMSHMANIRRKLRLNRVEIAVLWDRLIRGNYI